MSAENGTIELMLSFIDFLRIADEGVFGVFLTVLLEVVTGIFTCNVVALAIFLSEVMFEVFIAIPSPPIITKRIVPSNIPLKFIFLYFEIIIILLFISKLFKTIEVVPISLLLLPASSNTVIIVFPYCRFSLAAK